MTETREVTLRRLKMRSMRRGIKEMDLILQAFADVALASMPDDDLTRYDSLLAENDHDILAWVLGTQAVPQDYAPLIMRIAALAQGLTRPV